MMDTLAYVAARDRYEAAVQYIRVSDAARVLREAGRLSPEAEAQMQHAGDAYTRTTLHWRSLGANPPMSGRRAPARRQARWPTAPVQAQPEAGNVPVWTGAP